NASPEQLERRRTNLEAFDGRFSPAYQPLYDALFAVQREISDVDDDLRRLRRERGRLRSASDALHVVAAESGTVMEIDVVRGQYAARGQIAVTIEGLEPRIARGWLTQEMAAVLTAGMQVKLTVNTGDGRRVLDGTVANVTAGIDPEISPEFGTLVSVSVNKMTPEEIRAELPHLMPVAVRIQRDWVTSFTQRLASISERVRGIFSGDT
ncbi:MAG: HlyD family secretion protein, partial [Pseudomonadota bacterium]